MIYIHKFTVNILEENTYLVWDHSSEGVIIDPGCFTDSEKQALKDYITKEGIKPKAILLTHAHLDHVFGVKDIAGYYGINVWMNEREHISMEKVNPSSRSLGLPEPDSFAFIKADEGTTFSFGETTARALSTPGHSAGSLCWWFEQDKAIFTGDTLFAGCVGRTDLAGGSLEQLQHSLKDTLMQLEGDIDVFPGHGPCTTIGDERMNNPFIYEDQDASSMIRDAFMDADE